LYITITKLGPPKYKTGPLSVLADWASIINYFSRRKVPFTDSKVAIMTLNKSTPTHGPIPYS